MLPSLLFATAAVVAWTLPLILGGAFIALFSRQLYKRFFAKDASQEIRPGLGIAGLGPGYLRGAGLALLAGGVGILVVGLLRS